jgi:hypothetical protein
MFAFLLALLAVPAGTQAQPAPAGPEKFLGRWKLDDDYLV